MEGLGTKQSVVFFDKKENNLYYKKDDYTIRVLLDVTEQTYNGEVQIRLRSLFNLILPFGNGQRFLNVTRTSNIEIYSSEEFSQAGLLGVEKIEIPEGSRITAVESSVDDMTIFAAICFDEPSKLDRISVFRVKLNGRGLDLVTSFIPKDDYYDAVYDLRSDFDVNSNPILAFSEKFSKRICSFILEKGKLRRFGTLETTITTHALTAIGVNENGYTIADSVYNVWNATFFDNNPVRSLKKRGKCCALI